MSYTLRYSEAVLRDTEPTHVGSRPPDTSVVIPCAVCRLPMAASRNRSGLPYLEATCPHCVATTLQALDQWYAEPKLKADVLPHQLSVVACPHCREPHEWQFSTSGFAAEAYCCDVSYEASPWQVTLSVDINHETRCFNQRSFGPSACVGDGRYAAYDRRRGTHLCADCAELLPSEEVAQR